MIENCPKKQQNRSQNVKIFPGGGGVMPPDPLATVRFACIALGPPTENKEPPTPRSGYGLAMPFVSLPTCAMNHESNLVSPTPNLCRRL